MATLRNQLDHLGSFNSSNGAVGKAQFIPVARPVIFHNRVKQRLMEIQILRYSPGLFEIICSNPVCGADNIHWYGIYEHGLTFQADDSKTELIPVNLPPIDGKQSNY
jgi:hypothetical protein